MNKEAFHKKWYYRPIQILYWGSLIIIDTFLVLVAVLGIIGIGEDDIPIAGLFWAAAITLIYWLIKKIVYFVSFDVK